MGLLFGACSAPKRFICKAHILCLLVFNILVLSKENNRFNFFFLFRHLYVGDSKVLHKRISTVYVTTSTGNCIWTHLLKKSSMENFIFCALSTKGNYLVNLNYHLIRHLFVQRQQWRQQNNL